MSRVARAWAWAKRRRSGLVVVVLFAASLLYTAHAVSDSNHKFCGVVSAITARPVPKPADPRANPSRATSYEWYLRFVRLDRDLGC